MAGEFIKDMMMVGMGVQKKFCDYLETLAEEGRRSVEEEECVLKEVINKAEEGREKAKETCQNAVQNVLKQLQIPSEKEVDDLKKEVRSLKKKLQTLQKEEGKTQSSPKKDGG